MDSSLGAILRNGDWRLQGFVSTSRNWKSLTWSASDQRDGVSDEDEMAGFGDDEMASPDDDNMASLDDDDEMAGWLWGR